MYLYDKMISDDLGLLKLMTKDSAQFAGPLRTGAYWKRKARRATRELEKFGLADFRSSTSSVGLSFADNQLLDIRTPYRSGGLGSLKSALMSLPPYKGVLDAQVHLTKHYLDQYLSFKSEYMRISPRVRTLEARYAISALDTTRGGCLAEVILNEVKISHHYLQLLDTLDRIMTELPKVKLTDCRVMEIGGGFGVNAHLMVELFGVKKLILVDISPTLYVATQYLKSFYGGSVRDYRDTCSKRIDFTDDNSLEIFCLLPHQLNDLDVSIDFFHNAHSFVEMEPETVLHYAQLVSSILTKQSVVALVSYDEWNPLTTSDPQLLPAYFYGECVGSRVETLTPGRRNYQYLISSA